MPGFLIPRQNEIRHFHLFCGAGGGAIGFNRAHARIGHVQAVMRCIGGVDNDPAAVADFNRLAGPGTVLDLATREQHTAITGSPPPDGWQEATPDDIRKAAGHEWPHMVFMSPPCKGFSGLLSKRSARSRKYEALNRLTVRGTDLMLRAFADNPPEFVIMENVPRIEIRGPELLDEIQGQLEAAGYVVQRTRHNCGEVGGLAQNRHRFLLVARHAEKVPDYIYEPGRRPLSTIGEVIGSLPPPGHPDAGPLHRLPALQWRTWVRLALIEAGSDWRSLERLKISNGYVEDLAIVPAGTEWFSGILGVNRWDQQAPTITGQARPSTGSFAVADPQIRVGVNPARGTRWDYGTYGVARWGDVSQTITSQAAPGAGRFTVADPSIKREGRKPFNNVWRVIEWDGTAQAINGGGGPSAGGQAFADPRINLSKAHDYTNAGRAHYGVMRLDEQANTIRANCRYDQGPFSVADHPKPTEQGTPLIVSLDNTWHRPFTVLDMAAIQGFPTEGLVMDGQAMSAWRERIGNAVPPPAAEMIATTVAETLLLVWSGRVRLFEHTPIWVRPVAAALTLPAGSFAHPS